VDIRSQCKENWKSAQVVNFSPVDDPTIRQPGLDLPRQQWSMLNRFQTAQGYCGAWKKWNLAATDLCPCGEKQTMSHSVDSRPLLKLNGGLSQLHSADDEACLADQLRLLIHRQVEELCYIVYRHISGIGDKMAKKLVEHRLSAGPFVSRSQLLSVPGLGPKKFEQCAGFLRIMPQSQSGDADKTQR